MHYDACPTPPDWVDFAIDIISMILPRHILVAIFVQDSSSSHQRSSLK